MNNETKNAKLGQSNKKKAKYQTKSQRGDKNLQCAQDGVWKTG